MGHPQGLDTTDMDSVRTDEDAVTLNAEQVQHYHEHGYLQIDALTSADEVEQLQGIYDRLFETGADVDDRDRIELAGDKDGPPALPQILNPDHYAPELLETVAYRNAQRVARSLLGDEVRPTGMHAIRKPPRDGAETPWHQDEAYWSPAVEHRALSIWMPLQPATLDNGCMQFVPGSHALEVQPHRLINPDSHGLVATDPAAGESPVACPLPPGGATVHTSRTMHYAGPNRTDEPRRALIMSFACDAVPLDVPREFPWQRPEWSA
ncbi:MAG: phytanoyl-CoA dioxygenase family protein [Nocardioidaceae bacterium]